MLEDNIITLTREKDACPSDKFSRRRFFGTAAMAAAGVALAPRLRAQEQAKNEKPPAAGLGLGVADRDNIDLRDVALT